MRIRVVVSESRRERQDLIKIPFFLPLRKGDEGGLKSINSTEKTLLISEKSFSQTLRDSLTLGLTTAVVFFAVEFILVSIDGAHIRVAYMLMALGFYLLIGLALGIVGAGFARLTGNQGEPGTRLKLFHLAGFAVLFGLHLIFHHLLLTMRLSAVQRYVVAGGLIVGAAFILWIAEKVILRSKTVERLLSYTAGVLVLCILAAGGLYLNEKYLPLLFEAKSIVVNAIFVAALIGAYLLGSLLLSSRIGQDVRREVRAALVPAAIGLIVLGIISAHPIERFRMRIPSPHVHAGSTARPANVILITLDTCRQDRLSLYGYGRKTSPNIDAFAERAVVYDNAIANSPWTLPSHASMLTGLYPTTHGAHFVQGSSTGLGRADYSRIFNQAYAAPLRGDVTTLAEILKKNGYVTGAIVANSAYLFRAFGLGRGFDYYDDREGTRMGFEPVFETYRRILVGDFLSHRLKWYREAEEIDKLAFGWLDVNRSVPFFLFLNYNDLHTPYDPPSPYNHLYPGRMPSRSYDEWEIKSAVFTMQRNLTDKERQHFLSQYDGEINYLDHCLGLFFERLKRLGIYDDSMVILVGDHGESFGEHFFLEHGNHLYENEVHIPLIIKYPGPAKPSRVKDYAETVDILPTVLRQLDIRIPEGVEGRALEDGASQPAPALSELYVFRDRVIMYGRRFDRVLRAVYLGKYKYIWSSNGEDELYDLTQDPGETRNLIKELPDVAEAGRKSIESRLGPLGAGPKQPAIVDKEALERLKSVGYLE